MNDDQHDPGEARGDGRALHGYRNEVTWDDGQGRQPYANQGPEQEVPAAAHETEGGNRGAASGRNIDQLEQVKEKPERPHGEVDREDASGEGGVS